jgi:hypothetical protein
MILVVGRLRKGGVGGHHLKALDREILSISMEGDNTCGLSIRLVFVALEFKGAGVVI